MGPVDELLRRHHRVTAVVEAHAGSDMSDATLASADEARRVLKALETLSRGRGPPCDGAPQPVVRTVASAWGDRIARQIGGRAGSGAEVFLRVGGLNGLELPPRPTYYDGVRRIEEVPRERWDARAALPDRRAEAGTGGAQAVYQEAPPPPPSAASTSTASSRARDRRRRPAAGARRAVPFETSLMFA